VCRRATSNDDCATLKNFLSESTLNGDVSRAPVSHGCDVRLQALSTFNPFGCPQHWTESELQRAVPLTPAGGPTAAVSRSCRPPNPPRRTSSLSSAIPSPSSAVEKTSEMQKLASLAQKLAAESRLSAVTSRTLPTPRYSLPVLRDLNPPYCDDSPLLLATSAPLANKASHRLDLAASTSRQTVAEKEDSKNFALTNGTNSDAMQPAAACDTDKSVSSSTLHEDRSVSPQRVSANVATACGTSSAVAAGEVSELGAGEVDDVSTKNDSHATGDPAAAASVSDCHDCLELEADDCLGGPLPVSARLIITAPVSSLACFVPNPHRRSMCKPLKLTLPRVDEVDRPSSVDTLQLPRAPSHARSASLRRHDLPPDDVGCGGKVDPSNYGRSWYEVVRDDSSPSPSLAGDCRSPDTGHLSPHSSDKRPVMSGSLRRSAAGRRTTGISAIDDGREERVAVRINASSPILFTTNSARSLSVTTADHNVAKSLAGFDDDKVVTKGTSLNRLKKSRHQVMGQTKNETDLNVGVDSQKSSREPTAERAFSEVAANDSPATDENETESGLVFQSSFMSNSLGRHKSLRTGNTFADQSSAADNMMMVAPQLWIGVTEH